ncbi:MAG: hypothetical protein IJU04_06930, partial [Ruminococcus sp.]|nr:hypothetical protein [Ruminococcus sp.]
MKKVLSFIISPLILLSLFDISIISFAKNSPFDDDAVIVDVPDGPNNKPVDVVQTLDDTYEVITDSLNRNNSDEANKDD